MYALPSPRQGCPMRDSSDRPLITFSIVSHGHGAYVAALLQDLARLVEIKAKYLLTLNRPEDESLLGLDQVRDLTVIRNVEPKGFGANHNAAFQMASTPFFCILNPDLRMQEIDFRRLFETASMLRVGAVGPLVRNSAGAIEDSARRYPAPLRIIRRVVLRQRASDYGYSGGVIDVDWLAGMFLLFRAEAFADVSGFDEGYFMYLEDTDICRRLRDQGWRTVQDQSVVVVHDGQRASHRNLRHLRWHLGSMARFMIESTKAGSRQ
jgi:N-acetylglucosaminyl-diphospho-decaprenol L-rhamnosyltransferase